MVVVPCLRWVPMTVSESSWVPAEKEAPPPPCTCMSTKPGTIQWPVRSSVSPGAAPSPGASAATRRRPSTVSPPSSRTPPGSTTRAPVSTVRLLIGSQPPRREDPRREVPRPGSRMASPSAAGTIAGSGWNVTFWRTASRSGTKRVSPASARPPPMISVRGSSSVSPVTRPVASASMASSHTSWARGSPDSTALAASAAVALGSPHASAQASPTAEAEASRSRQPRCPQPHGGPSGRTTMWPISPALPCAPGSTVVPMPMAPAMPVPSGTNR